MRRAAFLVLCASCGAGAAPVELEPTDPEALRGDIAALSALGEKRVGTPGAAAAAVYLEGRLRAAGLAVGRETFRVPRHDVRSASLALTVDGAARAVGFDVLEGSGGGRADAEVVNCGSATPSELAGLPLAGKIALVSRSVTFHRSSQYRNVAAAGARAMLYISDAPANARQVGSVRRTFEALGPIPALSLGAADGAALLGAGAVRAVVDVDAAAVPADGANVVARIPGASAEQIVVGAHFDTWFLGANDNGAGAAALVALAARRARRPAPRRTLVFVAYDGEETGLYGGYDYMHKHLGKEPIFALLGFEVPAPRDATLLAFGRSNHAALDAALQAAGMRGLYPIYVAMDTVPALFGGIIPTDLQGLYRAGVPSATTATSYAWYHTRDDTPDLVDAELLARAVDAFDDAVGRLDALPDGALAAPDPMLWRADLSAAARGERLAVTLAVTDAAGAPRAGAAVEAQLLVDDFFVAATATGTTGGDGRALLDLPDAGGAHRYLHATAGAGYPLVEKAIPLPDR